MYLLLALTKFLNQTYLNKKKTNVPLPTAATRYIKQRVAFYRPTFVISHQRNCTKNNTTKANEIDFFWFYCPVD